jgi:GT2 family glycosyltransferase
MASSERDPRASAGQPRTAAVVVNWNGGAQNVECLESLLAQGLAPGDVVFVDNGSVDGSAEEVERRFPGIVLLRNEENLGFGEGANRGAHEALARGAALVFFVNNDVKLPAGTVERLVRELGEESSLGIVGPRVLYKQEPGRVWCAGGMLTWKQNLSTLLGHGEPDGPEWKRTKDVDYVAGCALLVRKEVLDRVGLFDARYFAYMEDVDLCLRAREAGYGVRLVGEAAAYHASSSATGGGYNPRRKYMMGVNSIWFLKRHARAREWARFVAFDVLTLPFLWLAGLFRGEGKAVLGKALGIFDGLRGKRVTSASIEEGAGWLW